MRGRWESGCRLLALALLASGAIAGEATAQTYIKRVTTSKFVASVDNGWVILGDFSANLVNGAMYLYNSKANPNFAPTPGGTVKLKTPLAGFPEGYYYGAGGIAFGPCAVAAS